MKSTIAATATATVTALAACCVGAQSLPPPDAAKRLASAMREARRSDGFEMRLSLARSNARETGGVSTRLVVIGRADARGARLLVRAIAPANLRDHIVAAEVDAHGHVRAVQAAGAASGPADPWAPLFDTPLTIGDLLGSWWDWPKQAAGGADVASGHPCELLRSRSDAASAGPHEVLSCIDARAGLAYRVEFFGADHRLLRTLTVERALRRADGRLAPRQISVGGVDGAVTEITVYGGDDNLAVPDAAFALLDLR